MKKLIVLFTGLFLFSGYNIAQMSVCRGYHGEQMGQTSANSSYNGAQSGIKGIFDPSKSEHFVEPKDVYSSYNPISEYSSTLAKPFDYVSTEDPYVIKKTSPGGSGIGVQDPLGDAVAPLLLFLLAYTAYTYRSRKGRTTSTRSKL